MSGDTNDGVRFGDVIIVDVYEGDVVCRWYRLRSTITDTFASPANIVFKIYFVVVVARKTEIGRREERKKSVQKIQLHIILMHFRDISVCCCLGFLLLLVLFCFDVVDCLPVHPEDKAVNPESILIRRERRYCVRII